MRLLAGLALSTAFAGAVAKAVRGPPAPTPAITPPPKQIKLVPAFKRDLNPRASSLCETECGSTFCCNMNQKCVDTGLSPSCVDADSADLVSSALGLTMPSISNSYTEFAYLSSLLDSISSLYSYTDYGSLLSSIPSPTGTDTVDYLSILSEYSKAALSDAAASTGGATSGSSSSSGSSSGSSSSSGSYTTTSTTKKKKSNTGAIVGGVVGGIAALAIIAGIIFIIIRKRRKPQVVTLPPGHVPGAGVQKPPYQPPPVPDPAVAPALEKPTGGYYGPSVPGAVELGMNTQKVSLPPVAPQQNPQWTGSTQYSNGIQQMPPVPAINPEPYGAPPVEMHGQSTWVPPPDGRTQPVEMYGGTVR